jgi:hypothetical protein
MNPIVIIAPTSLQTRLLITHHGQEVMRAILPIPLEIHPRAAPTLLEGLSLWLQQRLCVVLCAAERERSSLGLCDEGLDIPISNLFYEVGIAALETRNSRRKKRLGGPNSFRDLEQMTAWGVLP